ncbi:MAG TPA: beta-L-arabinofuranosidase domain-containing protein [Vicinamibacterales bacterium]|nr:beta-L-arabinofuranosidase domain-containing protein [Vicinamibacterales bacterium]
MNARARSYLRGTLVVVLVAGSIGFDERAHGESVGGRLPVKAVVPDAVGLQFVPVPLAEQTIGGLLGERLEVNVQRRLIEEVDPEPMLKGYRQPPGQQTWIGEHIGKFIDAASTSWAYTGNETLKRKLDQAVRDLLATQKADGYLGTYPEADRFIDYGDTPWEPNEKLPIWDVWVHKYNLIALLNYYQYTRDAAALAAARRVGDLLTRTYGPGLKSIVRNDWHVGMANTSVLEPMARLYRFTGEPRYLEFCRYIVRAWDEPKGPKIVTTLMAGGHVHEIGNAKGYEMTSNFVGLLELYRATGERRNLDPVLAAWEDIVRHRLYVSGTATWAELYRRDHYLRADGKVGEGCVTATWMQLNLALFQLTGEARYAEELERTIYNALLAAQHPESGRICYFTPLNGSRSFGTVSQGIPGVSCCSSSVPRAIALIPSAVWGVRRGGIAIALFTPGTARVNLPAGTVTITSETRFPEEGRVALTLRTGKPMTFPLQVRAPSWSRRVVVSAGDQEWTTARDGFIEIDRTWQDGDRVTIDIDLSPSLISGKPTYPNLVAVRRGPQILAADERLNPATSEWMNDLWIAGIAQAEPVLRKPARQLPKNWRGTQVYAVDGYLGNDCLGQTPYELVLVPLADAGYHGGEYRVWLQAP